jgi:hypothetical protein
MQHDLPACLYVGSNYGFGFALTLASRKIATKKRKPLRDEAKLAGNTTKL